MCPEAMQALMGGRIRHSTGGGMRTQVIIEDHVLPQLLTSAIEAYEVRTGRMPPKPTKA